MLFDPTSAKTDIIPTEQTPSSRAESAEQKIVFDYVEITESSLDSDADADADSEPKLFDDAPPHRDDG
jgi:hypothetical protein